MRVVRLTTRRLMSSASSASARPERVGIVAMDTYFPRQFVEQSDLEQHDGVSSGNYTVGLGQDQQAFATDREDIYSMCKSALANLMDKYDIDARDVGRLEVGTETILDHSKSVKSFLMDYFDKSGNTDIEGVDTLNACYGGTNAVINAINWVESSSWDGRYAVVVTGDIAEYEPGPARPTGGAGVVAMLIGRDAPIAFENVRASHMEHVYDFYKPNLLSPFPVVDGKFSQVCYLKALDLCYRRFATKFAAANPDEAPFTLDSADYVAFHAPYNKLVQKSYGRLLYNDFLASETGSQAADLEAFRGVSDEASYADRALEKAFVKASSASYQQKVVPTTELPKRLGNMYTGSLYAGIQSLVNAKADELAGKRALLFSYGSGLAATMLSARVGSSDADKAALRRIRDTANIGPRLDDRVKATPEAFNTALGVREALHHKGAFEPEYPADDMFDGAYYLTNKDDLGRRFYARK